MIGLVFVWSFFGTDLTLHTQRPAYDIPLPNIELFTSTCDEGIKIATKVWATRQRAQWRKGFRTNAQASPVQGVQGVRVSLVGMNSLKTRQCSCHCKKNRCKTGGISNDSIIYAMVYTVTIRN
eukprot:1986934-Amphidinium_carterae.1